jgi:hypothetical protein
MRDPQCNVFRNRMYGRIELPDRQTWFYISEPLEELDEESQRDHIKRILIAFRDSGDEYPKNRNGFNLWKGKNAPQITVGRPPFSIPSRDSILRKRLIEDIIVPKERRERIRKHRGRG